MAPRIDDQLLLPFQARACDIALLLAEGVQVNALVIETEGKDLTGKLWENVITGGGAFVVTANSYSEYPESIRQSLIAKSQGNSPQFRALRQ